MARRPPVRDEQGEFPQWALRPDPAGGGQVLGTGESASVVFDISNIVTTLPQGVTYAHVGYQNIPGYDDGFIAIEIIKVEPIIVEYFTADPPVVPAGTIVMWSGLLTAVPAGCCAMDLPASPNSPAGSPSAQAASAG